MAKKKDLLCAGCYKPIQGEHFTVPVAGKTTMAFHKDAHACAAASSATKQASLFGKTNTRGGGEIVKSEINYEGTE